MNFGKIGSKTVLEQGCNVAKDLCDKARCISQYTSEVQLASPLAKDTIQISSQPGKHKVPRFLYHFTTPEYYESIMRTGKLNASSDSSLDKSAVFMVELENLMKTWCGKITIGDKSWDLICGLLQQMGHTAGKKKIVLLKIPSSSINCDNLAVRSQKTYFNAKSEFGCFSSEEAEKLYAKLNQEIKEDMLKNCKTNNPYELNRISCEADDLVDEIFDKTLLGEYRFKDLHGKIPATQSNLFKQRKEPIEYIYYDDIQTDSIEKVGSADVNISENTTLEDVYKFFEEIFKNKPEAKSLRQFKLPKAE